jgi:hypothetical protein
MPAKIVGIPCHNSAFLNVAQIVKYVKRINCILFSTIHSLVYIASKDVHSYTEYTSYVLYPA